MTDAGKLQGEIPLGYYRVRRADRRARRLRSRARREAVLHIILSHHGCLEHGSPVVPCTREATLVHFCDNLGGRLGSFDRLEKELPRGERWSRFDRAIGVGRVLRRRRAGRGAPGRLSGLTRAEHADRRRGDDRVELRAGVRAQLGERDAAGRAPRGRSGASSSRCTRRRRTTIRAASGICAPASPSG